MIWLLYMGADIEEQMRMHRFGSYPLIDVRDNASLRSDRPSGLVGPYVATDSFADRSLRCDQPDGLIGRYVATGSFAVQSLCSDRPDCLVGRFVATGLFWTGCYVATLFGSSSDVL
ncbi:hypothetical protein F2Q68_00039435 [Brassica cretica]|uniref:Uncharacterized protein n=1 Tax=Brassica cretica TaxID=69181 RepID=A0A8S9MDL3_BRACR|nr:hypothetical protein F2Q68_00039435 [Brassica cretica]